MTTLRDLMIEQDILNAELENSFGEIPEDMEAQLAELWIKLPQKVDNCVRFLEKLDIETEVFKSKADLFEKKAQTRKNLKESISTYIKQQMIAHEIKELKGNNNVFKLQNGKASVEVSDQSKIPRTFIKQIVSEQPDKIKLYEALKRGEIFEGASLKQTIILKKDVL